MDTGGHSTDIQLDQLLIWNEDFELARVAPKSLKCYLATNDSNYFGSIENEICLETKFFFKDSVTNIEHLKCNLIAPKTQDTNEWIVNLFDEKDQLINDLIINFNLKEKQSLNEKGAKAFRSVDIRNENGQLVETVNYLVKTKPIDDNNNDLKIEEQEEQIEVEPLIVEQTTANNSSSFPTLQQQQQQQQQQHQLSEYSFLSKYKKKYLLIIFTYLIK